MMTFTGYTCYVVMHRDGSIPNFSQDFSLRYAQFYSLYKLLSLSLFLIKNLTYQINSNHYVASSLACMYVQSCLEPERFRQAFT